MTVGSAISSRLLGAALCALGAGLAAALFGLAQAARVVLGASFFTDGTTIALLLLLGAAAPALMGALTGFPLGLVAAKAKRGLRFRLGFAAGLLVMSLWALALFWFPTPASYDWLLPLQGQPAIFAGLAAVLLAAAALGTWLLRGKLLSTLGAFLALLVLGGWTVTAISLRQPEQTPSPGSPNLLWVTMDSLRADRVGAYGGPAHTPALDGLAAQGVIFERAFAQIALTGPSHVSMHSATGPWTHKVLPDGWPLPDELPWLSEELQRHGYATGAFVSSCQLEGELGFARGFHVYDDEFTWLGGSGDLLLFHTGSQLLRRFGLVFGAERSAARTVDRALAWLERQPEPWFAWVHLFDPHAPYDPPDPYATPRIAGGLASVLSEMPAASEIPDYMRADLAEVEELDWVLDQYHGEIAYADAQLARLLTHLDDAGIAANTVVAVNGDHGESLGEHGAWFRHGQDLYDPSTRIPLILRGPGSLGGGKRVSAVVELLDLAPTLLGLADIEAPRTMEGSSLLQAMKRGRSKFQARGLCLEAPNTPGGRPWRLVSFRAPRSLYLRHEDPDREDEYYDLEVDPDQTDNVLLHRLAGLRYLDDSRVETNADGEQLMGVLARQADLLLAEMGQEGLAGPKRPPAGAQADRLAEVGADPQGATR